MAAETGHAPSRAYLAQDGSLHLNGASLFDTNEKDLQSRASATAAAGAATANGAIGTITSEALTTAAGADYVLTLTNSLVTATSVVVASADNGTNTTEGLAINRVTPSAGSCIIRVRNTHATVALNGTIKINFAVLA